MDSPVKMELNGLSDLDRDEFEIMFENSGVEPADYAFVETTSTPLDHAQDFGLIAVAVVISPITIAAISVWLEKKRDRKRFSSTVRTWDERGQIRYESEISWDSRESAPPPAEVVAKLTEASKVDPDLLKQAITDMSQ